MKILFIGDIMGEPGRKTVARQVPRFVSERGVDLVIGNAENAAGGFGITSDIARELFKAGLHVITTGNHVWEKKRSSTTSRTNRGFCVRRTIPKACRGVAVWWCPPWPATRSASCN